MEGLWIICTAMLGAIAAYYISVILNKGAVFGSAVVTLLAGIVLPYFIPGLGNTLAVAATCGSYAGMVAVKNISRLREMSGVGIICGILFILATPAYIGVGGKLGTIAAIACFAWIGMKKLYELAIARKEESILGSKLMDQAK